MLGISNTTDLLQRESGYTFVTETDEIGTEAVPTAAGRPPNRGFHSLLWPLIMVTLIISTNGLSLAAFAVEKRLRGYNNYFIINLTISDFLFGFVLILTSVHTYLGRFPLSLNWCRVYQGVYSSLQLVSNLVIVVICIDRHRATYDPIGHFTSRSKRKAIYANICVWVVSTLFWFSFSTIPDFILQFDSRGSCTIWYFYNPIAQTVPIFIRFVLPFIIISILYVRIFVMIRETLGGKHVSKEFAGDIKRPENGESEVKTICTTTSVTESGEKKSHWSQQPPAPVAETGGGQARNRESAAEVRSATKTLLFIIISFFISWCPVSVILLVYAIKPSLIYPRFPDWFHLIPSWMPYANGLLNPLCYVISQPLFRKTVLGLLCHPSRYYRRG